MKYESIFSELVRQYKINRKGQLTTTGPASITNQLNHNPLLYKIFELGRCVVVSLGSRLFRWVGRWGRATLTY